MVSSISFAGGTLLGLASSLHCVGMCSGISLLLGQSGTGGSSPRSSSDIAFLHGGRIFSYAALGAVAGSVGALASWTLEGASGHALLRWFAAASLAWIGLSTAGLVPALALPGHGGSARWSPLRLLFRLPSETRRIASGLAWGLLPCGMVYSALLFAVFAGSALSGVAVMAGFGLGTLPALIVAHLGVRRLSLLARERAAQRWLGAAMTLVAGLSLIDAHGATTLLCRSVERSFMF